MHEAADNPLLEDSPLGRLALIIRAGERDVFAWHIEDGGEEQVLLTDNSFFIDEHGEYNGWWAPLDKEGITFSGEINSDSDDNGIFEVKFQDDGDIAVKNLTETESVRLYYAKTSSEVEDEERAEAEKARREEAGVQFALKNERKVPEKEVTEAKQPFEKEIREKEKRDERLKNNTEEMRALGRTRSNEFLTNIRNGTKESEKLMQELLYGENIATGEDLTTALRENLSFREKLRSILAEQINITTQLYGGTRKFGEDVVTIINEPTRIAGSSVKIDDSNIIPPDRFLLDSMKADSLTGPERGRGLEGHMPSPMMSAEYALRMLEGSWNYDRATADPIEVREIETSHGAHYFEPIRGQHRAMATLFAFGRVMDFDSQGNPR